MVRIQRFGVIKTATVVAVMYLLIFAVFFIPIAILVAIFGSSNSSSGNAGLSIVFLALIGVLFYTLLGWIFTAIACAIYNVAAGMVGGIELRIEAVEAPPPPASWAPSTTPTPPTPPTLPSPPPTIGSNQPPYGS